MAGYKPLWALDTIILPQCWQKAWHDKEVLSYAINPFKIYIKFNQALTSAHIRGKHFILSGKSKRQTVMKIKRHLLVQSWISACIMGKDHFMAWGSFISHVGYETGNFCPFRFPFSFFLSILRAHFRVHLYSVIVKGPLCAGMASALCIRDICLLLLILIIIVYLIWFQRSFLSSLWCCYVSLARSKIKIKHKSNVKRRKSIALVFALWISLYNQN